MLSRYLGGQHSQNKGRHMITIRTLLSGSRLLIRSGPSKMGLAASLFADKRDSMPVTFALAIETNPSHWEEYKMFVLRVGAEDGSKESWCLKGYLVDGDKTHHVEAYYRTDQLSGNMTLVK